MNKIIGGLKVLPKDERDLKLGNISILPALSELPPSFILDKKTVKEQITDFCSAASATLALEYTEGKELDELSYFAWSKELSGDVDGFGQDLRTACKTAQKIGAIPKSIAPFTKDKGSQFLRRAENYPPELKWKAQEHKQQSYFQVKGQHDSFDDARASLYLHKKPIILGLVWGWSLSQTILDGTPDGNGHAITVIGYERRNGDDYLILQNSYGEQAGDKGLHYITRETFNTYADMYGCFMFLDMDVSTARYYNNNKIKLTDNWMIQFIKILWNFLRNK